MVAAAAFNRDENGVVSDLHALNCHKGHFDLVLTDYNMPGMDGCKVAAAIKQVSPQTPVVLVSAHMGMLEAAGGDMKLFDDYLAKPFSVASLLAIAEKFLGQAEKEQARRSEPAGIDWL